MEWNYLGHASWLCVTNGLRLLFDPLLEKTHHGGVFEVVPRRTVNVPSLRPDFIVISHAHTDHFDVPSLRRLARMDPDTVVITSDRLVEHCAQRLGFRRVHVAQVLERINLDGVQLLTTPSYADATEWGMIVEERAVVTWNQVDTVHRSPLDVRTTIEHSARGLLVPSLLERVDLLLARWQPLCEIAPMLGDKCSFPHRAYGAVLEEIAAAHPRAVVPASAGGRHVPPFDWLNRFSHPVPMKRFLSDVRRRMPDVRAFEGAPGGRYVVDRDGEIFEPRGAASLVHLEEPSVVDVPADEWRPIHVPDVRDHNPFGYAPGYAREVCARWVREALAPSLAKNYGAFRVRDPVSFVIDLRFDGAQDVYTIEVSGAGASVRARWDPHWEALNVIAGSQLCAVIEGRACWGDVLLSGNLRAFERLYSVDAQGAQRANLGVTFVYYALSYEESFRRFVLRELEQER
jgi:hypothetical protein